MVIVHFKSSSEKTVFWGELETSKLTPLHFIHLLEFSPWVANKLWIHFVLLRVLHKSNKRKYKTKQISIHPILRFNYRYISSIGSIRRISIHPMLRFNQKLKVHTLKNINFNTSYVKVQLFQDLKIHHCVEDFNTSYVKVQHLDIMMKRTEILHFNTSYVKVQRRFKMMVWTHTMYFNTSYVKVQRSLRVAIIS